MRIGKFTPATFCLLALFLTACPGLLRQAYAQDVPFTGVVIQNQTDVRAGGNDRFYRVGELNKGQLVQVDEVIVGWYKIVPPEGFYSYISKAFVDAKNDGTVGVVNADRSRVYAADVNGPAGSYRVQVILNQGDGVQIVDEEGSHYKIVPPPNAYVYLPPGSVRRALTMETQPQTPDEPEAVEEPVVEPEPAVEPEPVVIEPTPEPEPTPVVEVEQPDANEVTATEDPASTFVEPKPAVEAEVSETNTSDRALDDMLGEQPKPTQTVEATEPPTETGPAVEVLPLAELEARFEAARALPLEEQPLDELIAQYQALLSKGDLSQSDAYRVRSRLALLRHDKRIAEGLAVIAAARASQAPLPEPVMEPVPYDAIGRLLASSVYDGRTLPRMFRIVDATTGRSLAYIRPVDSIDATQYLGKLVGIKGETAYDPALKLKIITVEQITPLQSAE